MHEPPARETEAGADGEEKKQAHEENLFFSGSTIMLYELERGERASMASKGGKVPAPLATSPRMTKATKGQNVRLPNETTFFRKLFRLANIAANQLPSLSAPNWQGYTAISPLDRNIFSPYSRVNASRDNSPQLGIQTCIISLHY